MERRGPTLQSHPCLLQLLSETVQLTASFRCYLLDQWWKMWHWHQIWTNYWLGFTFSSLVCKINFLRSLLILHCYKLECLSVILLAGKSRSKHLDWSPVGCSVALKYQNKVKVTYSDKQSSLFQYGVNYNRKKFYCTCPLVDSGKALCRQSLQKNNHIREC
jgi:hypothetical protein